MRWAVEGIRPDSGKMIHPSDGTAWKNFVKKYPLKAGDPRSVAIAISTDGFNPYAHEIIVLKYIGEMNHIATGTARASMENYSLLMGAAAVMKMAVEMAAVSMEKPSGGTSRSAVPEQTPVPDLGF
ncbi:hypothetical protein QYE76_044643 [Lolium multiflorum]|uniref:Uncharacterized protein n=1 Tax=Lolium multiflorum TaxID=4521 RepID=A0AAD8TJ03_LOLMU|nr:hypothetical protein QYE76_044643 [Lolium multiflorum]